MRTRFNELRVTVGIKRFISRSTVAFNVSSHWLTVDLAEGYVRLVIVGTCDAVARLAGNE